MFIKDVFDYEKSQDWKYKGDKPAIIDLYADWCGPCRMTAPIMKDLAKEYAGKIVIYKVNVDKERELAALFNASSIPLFVFIHFVDHDLSGVFFCQIFHDGRCHAAGTTPVGIQVNDGGFVTLIFPVLGFLVIEYIFNKHILVHYDYFSAFGFFLFRFIGLCFCSPYLCRQNVSTLAKSEWQKVWRTCFLHYPDTGLLHGC